MAPAADATAIKPHHFVDILTSLGQGHPSLDPHPYGHALHKVTRELLADRDATLCIELGADDICLPCRHNVKGLCDDVIDTSYRPLAPKSKREWNLIIDQRWCAVLGIGQGDRIAAREMCRRILDCLDEIDGIYREIPADRNARRRSGLEKGALEFLGSQGTQC